MFSVEDTKSVLCVGQICADYVTLCDNYPPEDTENRVKRQYWQRGGNAANTSVVLSNLGTPSEFLGTFPDMAKMKQRGLGGVAEARFALHELDIHGVKHNNLALRDCQKVPSTCIVLSEVTGSRTIYHDRGTLDELTNADLLVLDLQKYCWIHFEGRGNIDVMRQQMLRIEDFNENRKDGSRIGVSLELEIQANEGLTTLCPHVDLAIVSSYFALHLGHKTAEDCVIRLKSKVKPGAAVVCSWGHLGAAYIKNITGYEAEMEPAVKPEAVVDTIGAGDTFQGALIHAMLGGLSLKETVAFACRVASKKISDHGYDGIIGMGLQRPSMPLK